MDPFGGVVLFGPVFLVFFKPFCDDVDIRGNDRGPGDSHGRLWGKIILRDVFADGFSINAGEVCDL
jgi:hypothetical protein